MDSNNKGSGFGTILINLVVIAALFVGLGAFLVEKGLPEQIAAQKHEESMAVLGKSDQQIALEQGADIAKSGFMANAAIAASADISQTKIAQAIPNSLWAVAVIVLGVAFIMYMLMHRKPAQQQGSALYYKEPEQETLEDHLRRRNMPPQDYLLTQIPRIKEDERVSRK